MEWYYHNKGQQHGPVQESELQRLAQSGELSPEDLVWNPSMGEQWATASTIEGLFVSPPEIPKPSTSPSSSTAETSGSSLIPNKELMRMARESLKGKWGLAIGMSLLWFLIWVVLTMIQSTPTFIAMHYGYMASHGQGLVAPMKNAIPLPYRIASISIQIVQVLISGAFTVGFFSFYLNLVRSLKPKVSDLFSGLRIFWKAFFALFLVGVFSVFWILLLQIPAFALSGILVHQFKPAPWIAWITMPSFLICMIAAISFIYSYAMTFFVLADDHATGPLKAIRQSKGMMKERKLKLFFLQLRFLGWFLLALLTLMIGGLWVGAYYHTALAHFYDDVRTKTLS